jgi:hypothetical protein
VAALFSGANRFIFASRIHQAIIEKENIIFYAPGICSLFSIVASRSCTAT